MADFNAKLCAIRRFLLELIFPAFCMGCGEEGSFLCDKCSAKIPRLVRQVCPACGRECDDNGLRNNEDGWHEGRLCVPCKTKPGFYLDSLIAISEYEDKSLLARAIHALKYEFVEDLAIPLAGLFSEKLKNTGARDYVICPVPLHKKRYRWRGFNQVELLARLAVRDSRLNGRASGLEMRNLLERTTFSKPQMELKKEERARNVADAFRCVAPAAPEKVLLLDDVATTIATLNACAKALKAAGVKTVSAIVLARVN